MSDTIQVIRVPEGVKTLYHVESFERADSLPRVGAFTVYEAVLVPVGDVIELTEGGTWRRLDDIGNLIAYSKTWWEAVDE